MKKIKDYFIDIYNQLYTAWLICPDHCINIATFSFMIILSSFFSTLPGAFIFLFAGMTGIMINANFIKSNLSLK